MTEWISVDDKLPQDFQLVLCLGINESGDKEIMTGHRTKGNWTHSCPFYITDILDDEIKISHWMELPDLSKEE